ncbi:MAG: hypothetical protein HY367_01385 [Candidatus Aenigmarchaeota archaeon]|nr:hypothetical protein [Candidatus Aenigmarchaeota archaeon]
MGRALRTAVRLIGLGLVVLGVTMPKTPINLWTAVMLGVFGAFLVVAS